MGEARTLVRRRPMRAMRTAVALGAVMVLTAGVSAQEESGARSCWTVQTAESQLVIHVRRAGLLSPALHDHHFVPAEWQGQVCFDPRNPQDLRVELTVQAGTLQDSQPALSKQDLAKVERQVQGPEILNAGAHPVIRFEGDDLAVERSSGGYVSGRLRGRLTLGGVTNDVPVPVTARWSPEHLRAAGKVSFKQSAFGIEPYSRYLGTVRVEDEVTVEFAVDATPQ